LLSKTAYHEQISYDIDACFDASLLEQALTILFERHELLRTCFYSKDFIQVVLKSRKPEFYQIDGSTEQYLLNDRNKAFDLTNDVLLRLGICKTGPNTTRFVWSYHHILMDGWCVGIISKDFYSIYYSLLAGEPVSLPQVKPYSNYIKWLRSQERSGNYWNKMLEELNALTPVCTTTSDTYKDAREVLSLSVTATKQLQELAAANRVTLSTLLECVWAIVLGRYNNTTDVLFGKIVAGRPSEIDGIESMVGLFINTIPSRIKYEKGMAFKELLQQVQEQVLESEHHQYHSLAGIQKASKLGNKIFDHIFAFENYPYENLEIKNVEAFEQTNYDFNIVAAPGPSLTITFKYNENVFEKYYVEGIRSAFEFVIGQICTDPAVKIENIALVDDQRMIELFERFIPAE
ncbi:MAG TPA: condensation domain-containing protein, partial [Chitinophagaceae bacterium]|nr:condensation domain-containing protein [Chitinophagaceae bacterium]